MFSGCARQSDLTEEANIPSLPKQWQSQNNELTKNAEENDWTNDFNDPNLSALIQAALNGNLSLQQSALRAEQRRSAIAIAHGERLPSLDYSISAGGTLGDDKNPLANLENYEARLSASWELDVWGRLKNQEKAALKNFQASQADFNAARLALAGDIARLWFSLGGVHERMRVAQASLESWQRSLEVMRLRYLNGRAAAADVARLQQTIAENEASIANLKNNAEQIERELMLSLGDYPHTKQIKGALPELPQTPPAGMPSDLLERRPDVAASRLRYESAYATFEQREAERLPRFSLTASAGNTSTELSELLEPESILTRLALNLAGPIFDGARRKNIAKQQAQVLAEAEISLAEKILRACFEVERALGNEIWLRKQLTYTAEANERAALAAELRWQAYADGVSTLDPALDADRDRFRLEQNRIELQQNLLTNRVQLYIALGGSFFAESPLSPESLSAIEENNE